MSPYCCGYVYDNSTLTFQKQEQEKRKLQRLSAVERNQMETNKRLEEVMRSNHNVMQSNQNLQRMLQSVLTSLSRPGVGEELNVQRKARLPSAKSSEEIGDPALPVEGEPSKLNMSEEWWDRVCRTSGDEENESKEKVGAEEISSTRSCQVGVNQTHFTCCASTVCRWHWTNLHFVLGILWN